jgi:hypothetical protein
VNALVPLAPRVGRPTTRIMVKSPTPPDCSPADSTGGHLRRLCPVVLLRRPRFSGYSTANPGLRLPLGLPSLAVRMSPSTHERLLVTVRISTPRRAAIVSNLTPAR